MVRDRLLVGDTDSEVVAAIVARYGEFILLRPDVRGVNLALWLAGPAMLLGALGIGIITIRRRATHQPETLSATEKARLDEIMRS